MATDIGRRPLRRGVRGDGGVRAVGGRARGGMPARIPIVAAESSYADVIGQIPGPRASIKHHRRSEGGPARVRDDGLNYQRWMLTQLDAPEQALGAHP